MKIHTHLASRASKIRAEHDHPWGLVTKLLSAGLETVFQKFDITATAVSALLVLYFVLYNEGLCGKIDGLCKCSGNGVVGSFRLCDETLVTGNDGEHGRLFDVPFTDVRECLSANRSLLRGL